MGLSEKTFLNPKKMTASREIRDEKGPSLDDFDKEIEIYQVCSIKAPRLCYCLPIQTHFQINSNMDSDKRRMPNTSLRLIVNMVLATVSK